MQDIAVIAAVGGSMIAGALGYWLGMAQGKKLGPDQAKRIRRIIGELGTVANALEYGPVPAKVVDFGDSIARKFKEGRKNAK